MTSATPAFGLSQASWLTAPATQAVLALLDDGAVAGEGGGAQARVVGGAVRNGLLGLPVSDIDIATTLAPHAVMARARAAGLRVIPTGLDHGTVTIVVDHQPFEVTTLRRDVETFGRHATVAFTADWAVDASRRDFTINALSCDAAGRVYDPVGGLADLAQRRIRFIGCARARIAEDHLRILRFFRFHAQYGQGPLDADGLQAATRMQRALAQLSAERIRSEVVKLLVAPGVLPVIGQMADHGFWPLLLGTVPHRDMLARMIAAEAAAQVRPNPARRLAALSVSVGCDVPLIAHRLRLSNDEKAELEVYARAVSDPQPPPADATHAGAVVRYRMGEAAGRSALLARMAMADDRVGEGWSTRERWLAVHGAMTASPDRKLPVDGRAALAAGCPSGKAVGGVLAEVEAWWIEAGFPDDIEAAMGVLREAIARRGQAGQAT